MIGRGLGFTRWYDRIPELSQAVRMMEVAPATHQQVIARIIVGSLQMHQIIQRAEHGLKKLGSEKVIGLMKSKGKRRWYDQDPTVHLAFNYLYLMDDKLRHEMAVKMIVCLNALEEAARTGMPTNAFPRLVKSVFDKPLFSLLETLEFIVQQDKTGDTYVDGAASLQAAQTSSGIPGMEELAADHADADEDEMLILEDPATSLSSAFNAGADGMRIVRLRKT